MGGGLALLALGEFVPVDYVITWVDGGDPAHREARRNHPPDEHLKGNEEAVGDVRFVESGEIYYNIASVLKYAPFIRRIFIVTDNQKPRFLESFFREGKCDPSFIRIVSHDEIFDGLDAARPSFNSLSIEAALWRIPGLSEKFIYANDDFFFNAPVEESDFFAGGRPVLHGKWNKPEKRRLKNIVRRNLRKWTGRGPNMNPTFRKSLDRGAVVAGVTNGFMAVEHHPHPLRKSVFREFFETNPDVLNGQVGHRYRHVDQFNPVSLGNHLELLRGGLEIEPPRRVLYMDYKKNREIDFDISNIEKDITKYGCIQGLEKFPYGVSKIIKKIMNIKFKDKIPEDVIDFLGSDRREAFEVEGAILQGAMRMTPMAATQVSEPPEFCRS